MSNLKMSSKAEERLGQIKELLTHLNGEVAVLESAYSQLLGVLQRFEGASNTDDLTGLLRRRAFFRKWELLLNECQRLERDCGVLLIDVDHFKKLNDTHGHPTGDEVLRRIAGLIQQYESPNAFACRLGGEEFAIAVQGTDAELVGLAEFLRRGVERLHGPVVGPDGKPSQQVQWRCTISVGIASARKVGFEASRLLKVADDALYDAKGKGRNQVRTAA